MQSSRTSLTKSLFKSVLKWLRPLLKRVSVSQREEVWEIGSFQLESIVQNNVGMYILVDLRSEKERREMTDKHWNSCFRQAHLLSVAQVLSFLQMRDHPKESPVIVVCQKGKKSLKVARQLIKDGYLNVYVLNGGANTLLRERA